MTDQKTGWRVLRAAQVIDAVHAHAYGLNSCCLTTAASTGCIICRPYAGLLCVSTKSEQLKSILRLSAQTELCGRIHPYWYF
jgi:hypothetical protein